MAAPVEAVQLASKGSVVRLAQVTDTHLGEQAGTRLLELDTDYSLRAVLDQLQQEQQDLSLSLIHI